MRKLYYAFSWIGNSKYAARTNDSVHSLITDTDIETMLVIALEGGYKNIGEFEDSFGSYRDYEEVYSINEVKRKLNIEDVDIVRLKTGAEAKEFMQTHPDYELMSALWAQYGYPYAYKIIYVGESDTDIVSM